MNLQDKTGQPWKKHRDMHSEKGNSMNEGPEIEESFICVRNWKEISVAWHQA